MYKYIMVFLRKLSCLPLSITKKKNAGNKTFDYSLKEVIRKDQLHYTMQRVHFVFIDSVFVRKVNIDDCYT